MKAPADDEAELPTRNGIMYVYANVLDATCEKRFLLFVILRTSLEMKPTNPHSP
jgi:hypothetical protein